MGNFHSWGSTAPCWPPRKAREATSFISPRWSVQSELLGPQEGWTLVSPQSQAGCALGPSLSLVFVPVRPLPGSGHAERGGRAPDEKQVPAWPLAG